MTTAIKERPIIFSPPMVRAILEGRKTQTRRVAKPQPMSADHVELTTFDRRNPEREGTWQWCKGRSILTAKAFGKSFRCPYGRVGDLLWVREKWGIDGTGHGGPLSDYRWHIDVGYAADKQVEQIEVNQLTYATYNAKFWEEEDANEIVYHSPIYMPRWASRISLEITGVRAERLQHINKADIYAEGIGHEYTLWRDEVDNIAPPGSSFETPQDFFARAWNRINGKSHPWQSNPWVWVIEFRLVAKIV